MLGPDWDKAQQVVVEALAFNLAVNSALRVSTLSTFKQAEVFISPFVGLKIEGLSSKLTSVGKLLDFILSGEPLELFSTGDHLKDLYEGNLITVKTQPGIPPVLIQGPEFRFPPDDGGALGASIEGQVGLGPVNLNVGLDVSIPGIGPTLEQKAKQLNIVGTSVGETVPKPNLVDSSMFDPYASVNTKFENIGGVDIEKPDFESMFLRSDYGPSFSEGVRGYRFFAPSTPAPLSSEKLRQMNAQTNIDSYFTVQDYENGYLEETLSEIDAVVPFYFQDLRKPDRFLYFRAFLTQFGESLNPEWNSEKFYGRIDPVGTYMNTVRTFNVGFKICAMSKQGLAAMWRKINNFCKMVYPTYKKGIMVAAPVLRMKIGDVCCDGSGLGLPGWLENIEFDYSSAPWEISPFNSEELGRAPMWADVSFSFQVIHETNPEIDDDYNFNIDTFRKMGTLSDRLAIAGNKQLQSEAQAMEQQNSEGTTPDSENATTSRR